MRKHSKYKNTGILFELLVRQIASDVLSEGKNVANKVVKEYFSNSKTEISKELQLYQTLLNDKFDSERMAEKFINKVVEARLKLDNKVLKQEKYELVKEVVDNYNDEDFFKSRVQDYKVYASVYKIFEDVLGNTVKPADVITSRATLVEHITSKKISEQTVRSKLTDEFEKLDKDIRLLAYRTMISRFNEKYETLDNRQKGLLRQYINNITNTTTLRSYIDKEIPTIQRDLFELIGKIEDEATKIKVEGVASQIEELMKGPLVEDYHILQMMRFFELIKELNILE